MKDTAQALTDRFIEDRDAVRAAFRMENAYIYPVCAQIFLAADKPVERERLDRCKALVRSSAGVFSNFRGNIQLPLICALAASEDPEDRWDRAQRYYALLKESFPRSEYLALAALLLTDAVPEADLPALAARGKALYQRMKAAHPFLTGREDSVFALLLAESPRNDDALAEDMEACYQLLDRRFPKGNALQSVSHVLALYEGAPEEKVDRMIELFDAIGSAGGKYGKEWHLPVLAALAMGPGSAEETARRLLELDGCLAGHKGYRGLFGFDRRTRSMHAAMLLSLSDGDAGPGTERIRAAAQQSTLTIVTIQQILMCALIASSAASSAATAGASH